MDSTLYIILALFILLVTIGIAAIIYSIKKQKHANVPPDYYQMFMMGIIFMGAGSALFASLGISGGGMFFIGLIFTIISLTKKDEWKKDHKRWEHLDAKDKKQMKTMLILGLVAFIMGLAVLMAYLF